MGLSGFQRGIFFFIAFFGCVQCGMGIDNATTTTTEVTTVSDVTDEPEAPIDGNEAARDQHQHQQREIQRRQLITNPTTPTMQDNQTESTGGFVPSVDFQFGPVVSSAGPIIDIPRLNETDDDQTTPRANRTRLRSPFNTLGTIQFENGEIQQKNDKKLPPEPPFRPTEQGGTFVKFVDDPSDSNRQYTEEEISGSKSGTSSGADVSQGFIEPIYHQNYQVESEQAATYAPEGNYANDYQQYVTYETKPAKYHDTYTPLVHHHHHTIIPTEMNNYPQYQTTNHLVQPGPDEKPEMVINVHPISYQATSYDMLTKPKTVIYVTTHDERTKTPQKYPYGLQPAYEHQEAAATGIGPEQHLYPLSYEPHPKSISPWKKILHVIGAFLPLGLLFALLSPKVVTYDQGSAGSNDPGIVLSKLRVDDLPAEHKTTTGACEERLICRLLSAAGDSSAGSAILRTVLRQITDRTPESAVRKKELDRIFEAAKLGNCDILTCNFYDGT